jgi:hypothetical protein
VWDSVGTGTNFAPSGSDPRYVFNQQVDTKRTTTEGFLGVYMHEEESLSLYDPDKKTAYFWTYDAQSVLYYVGAAPMRTLLHWFLSESDIHLMHGAVVGTAHGSVLLSARGGSGKSTTALACLYTGMQYLADDYVAIGLGEQINAYSLYNSVKISRKEMHRAPALREHVWNTQGEKSVVFLDTLFPEQIVQSSPLRAICIPVITHTEKTVIVPASKAQAMLALLPTTLFQLPLADTDKIGSLKKIIARLPCYFLNLGRDSMEAAGVIRAFIEQEHV